MQIGSHKIIMGRLPLAYLFLAGTLAGILLMNIGKSVLLNNTGLLNEYVLYDMKSMTVDSGALFWYVTGKRMKCLVFVAALSTTSIGLVIVTGAMLWYGAAVGMFITAAVLRYGLKGVLLMIVSIFPQSLLYVPAIFFFMGWCEQVCREIHQKLPADKRRNVAIRLIQLFIVTVVVIIGCFLESYVNPMLLKKFLKIF